jgi:hypothetical protein
VGPALIFINGMMNLANGLLDPHNIPRGWKANPNYVLDTYRRFGNIPKKCVRRLYKGKQCLGSRKEEKVNTILKEATGTNIISYKPHVGGALVKVHGCEESIEIDLLQKKVILPTECEFLKRGHSRPPKDPPLTTIKSPPKPAIVRPRPVPKPKPRTVDPEERPVVVVVRPPTRPAPSQPKLEVIPFRMEECYVYTNIRGEQYIYLYNFRVKGVTATGPEEANWGIKIYEGQTKPIYRAWSGESTVTVKNQRIVLKPGETSFKIVSLNNPNKVINVPIKGCDN